MRNSGPARAWQHLAAKWKMDQGHRDSDVFLVGIAAKVQILIDFPSPSLQLPNTTHKCAFCVGETAPGPGPKRKYHSGEFAVGCHIGHGNSLGHWVCSTNQTILKLAVSELPDSKVSMRFALGPWVEDMWKV